MSPVATAPDTSLPDASIEKSLSAAENYIQQQDFAKAIAILATLVSRAPNDSRGHELYGQALMQLALQGDRRHDAPAGKEFRRKAYEEYERAAALKPDVAGLQHSAGQIAIEAGETAAALGHFRQAERLDPKNPQFPLFEAQLLIQARQFDEARAAIGRVLAIDPDAAVAYASLAMIDLELGETEAALKNMAQARQIDPADVGFRAQEARIHRRSGNPARAIELLSGLSAADRTMEVVAFELAAAYEAMNDPMSAAKVWQNVAQANPAGPRAWLAAVRASEALLQAGEREQAMMWFQQAQMAAPNQPEVKALAAKLTP